MNISRRDQGLLVIMILLLLGAGFFRFVYMPKSQEIQTLNAASHELELEKMRLTEIKNAPVKPGEGEDEFAHLDKSLPSQEELVPLLTLLDDTITECKLPFGSLDYKGASAGPDGVNTLVFNVGVKGSVYQLLNLLTKLENTERLISVGDVSFSGVKKEAPQSSAVESEGSPPVYYIEPPGIPEAKLQRIKLEVVAEETQSSASEPEKPVASTFLADNYDMKITIKAYYLEGAETEEPGGQGEDAATGTEGEV